jgi:hypothetical protein
VVNDETDLDRLLRVAEHHARTVLVTAQLGELTPLFHLVCPGTHDLIVQAPFHGDDSKEAAAQEIRELIREHSVTAYMFVSEAWMIVRSAEAGVSERAAQAKDRVEVVIAIATDGVDHKLRRWRIKRDKKGRCVDLALDSEAGESPGYGRFDNLFTRH